MRFLFFIFFAILVGSLKAQFSNGNEVKLITGTCKLEPYQNGLKPDFSIDARRTLFQKRWVAVMGLKMGVQYKRVHRMGLGVYFLNTRVFDSDFEFDLDIDEVEYEFRYSTIYYDRVLYFSRKWEFGANLHFGGGTVRVFYQNPDNPNDRIELNPVEFSTIELATYGEYNVLYWLSVGGGIGYREVFGTGKDLRKEFSSPIVVVNLQLKLFKLARSFYDENAKYEF